MQLLAQHATGLAPYLTGTRRPATTTRELIEQLADAYRAFLPGGNESVVAERLAGN